MRDPKCGVGAESGMWGWEMFLVRGFWYEGSGSNRVRI